MSIGQPRGPEDNIEAILNASEVFIAFIIDQRNGAFHSKDQDRVDLLNTLQQLFDVLPDEASGYPSLEDYLQDKAYGLQSFPHYMENPIIASMLEMMESNFGYKPKEIKGRSEFYEESVQFYAKQFRVPVERIRRALSYDQFMDLSSGEIIDHLFTEFRRG